MPEWTLADRLRKARHTAGLQQREIADRLDVTSGAYAQWEAGKARPRNVVSIAKRIEMLTGVSAAWILGVDAETPRPVGPAGASGVARPEGFEPPTFWLGVSALPDAAQIDVEHEAEVISLDDRRDAKKRAGVA